MIIVLKIRLFILHVGLINLEDFFRVSIRLFKL
jgi:hypothetical protein